MQGILLFFVGILVFFIGLSILKKGLLLLNNWNVRNIIKRFTTSPLKGCLTSCFITMLVQSSSVVTIIAISMVDAGLMEFVQALGIVLGTNIGTTITGQLMAFNLEKWGMPFLLLGGAFILLNKKRLRILGIIFVGLGLIFTGMFSMEAAFTFNRKYPLFIYYIELANNNTYIATIFGIIITAIIQSSSAVTGIVLALAKNNQLNLLSATAIIMGSNVGTCITALLAAINSTPNGKRVAIAHVFLNVLGVLAFLPFLELFTFLMAKFSNNLPRQIAHTHSVFNIVSSVIVLIFVNAFAKFICMLVPDKK